MELHVFMFGIFITLIFYFCSAVMSIDKYTKVILYFRTVKYIFPKS